MSAKISLTSPPFLRMGDTVAIVGLASKLDRDSIQAAIKAFENWGLNVVIGDSVGAADFTFSGTDELRQRDFQRFIDNKNIRAIFSARGGYGSSRIIDAIDFASFVASPKWIIGFSDITAIHGKIQNLGFQSIHGPMPKTMFWDAASDNYLKDILFGNKINYTYKANSKNKLGKGFGQIIGGNLALLTHAIGSASDLNFNEKILFIEDIGEYLYTIDRMMVQLKRAKKLENLSGLIVGQFSSIKENDEPFGKTAYEIIEEHTSSYNYPIAFDFPIGHTDENWAVRCGEFMSLSVTDDGVRLCSA